MARTVVPPSGYLARVRELCTKHNVLLVCNEIQTASVGLQDLLSAPFHPPLTSSHSLRSASSYLQGGPQEAVNFDDIPGEVKSEKAHKDVLTN
ncbi:hypothetical protein SCLCIDRAFT_28175 [Scleroderma citrinum Foug A]|uniref:Ornithine aminotransferase n=1 Tax=Scleroderma citrinum Foug A TaxID=1036808 RepID=A0A0C3DQK1_9AGAM|nr:hypothetical protein SCLCIDRAFT_28175 [Scleroderma citrinum Foug A]